MDKIITALLIDDDFHARVILKRYLEDAGNVHVVASLGNTMHAVNMIMKHDPDVVFLDINMPYEDGLKFAVRLKASGAENLLVFTTAYQDYAIEAFEIKPFDFLVKPFGLSDISILINKISDHLDRNGLSRNPVLNTDLPCKLKFKTNYGYLFLEPHEIVFIRSLRNSCELFLTTGVLEQVSSPISIIYREIFPFNFRLINRSVVINSNYIARIDRKSRKCVVCTNKTEFEFIISKTKMNFFENLNVIKLG